MQDLTLGVVFMKPPELDIRRFHICVKIELFRYLDLVTVSALPDI